MSTPERRASISVDSSLDSMQVSLVDSSFNEVATGTGGLRATDLLPGIYELRLSAGTVADSRLISLSPGEEHSEVAELAFPTATPLPGSSTWDPRHQHIAERASLHIVESVQGEHAGGLLVMCRVADGEESSAGPPELEVQRVTEEADPYPPAREVGVPTEWLRDSGPDWVVGAGAVGAGGYSLRTRQNGAIVEQSIWVAPGWQTLVFLPSRGDGVEVGRATIVMAPVQMPWSPELALRTAQANELALAGLREHRSVLPDDLTQLLEGKFLDPMLGLVGAHSLLLSPTIDWEQFDVVVHNLARLLPGLPDVAALKLLGAETRMAAGERGGETAEPPPPVSWPPMLFAGYAALVRYDAIRGGGTIVAGSPAEAVAGLLRGDSIWTAWDATPSWLLESPRRRGGLFSSPWGRSLLSIFASPDLGEELRGIEPAEPAIRQVAEYLASVADVEEPESFREMLQTELGNAASIAAATTVPLTAVNNAIRAIEDRTATSNKGDAE